MAATFANNYVHRGMTGFVWYPESAFSPTPGTAGTGTPGTARTPTTASKATFEPCDSFVWTPQRVVYVDGRYRFFPATIYDNIETIHHAQVVISCPYSSQSIAAYALASLMGDITNTGTVEALTSSVHTFTPGVNGTRQGSSFTLWYKVATPVTPGTAETLSFTFGTVQSVKLTWDPNAQTPVMAEVTMMTRYPGSNPLSDAWAVALPGPTTVGLLNPATLTYGFQGTFNIQSGNSGTAYPANPGAGDLMIERVLEVYFSADQHTQTDKQTFQDIIPGELNAVANLNLLYNGMAANTPFADFIKYKTTGFVSPNSHEIKFTDTDGNYVDVQFWPAKWTNLAIDDKTGQSLKVGGTLTSYQDSTSATQTSPIYTAVSSLALKNSITSGLIW